MKILTFDDKDPIALFNFLAMFQTACDFNSIHEGATKWIFQMYTRGAAQDVQEIRYAGCASHRDESLSIYAEVKHFLLRSYATDDNIADAHNEVVSYKHSQSQKETEYSNRLYKKALRCGRVFSQHRLKSEFVEGVPANIRQTTRQFKSNNASCDLTKLARHACSMRSVSRGSLINRRRTSQGMSTTVINLKTTLLSSPSSRLILPYSVRRSAHRNTMLKTRTVKSHRIWSTVNAVVPAIHEVNVYRRPIGT